MARGFRTQSPRPFLKWAGGKGELLPEILRDLPEGRIDHYIEPFLGGGAVLLELARLGRLGRATVGDRNLELVDTWRAVKADPHAILALLDRWGSDAETYYRVRATAPESLPPLERAARVLYLNRNGFNGLYRKNSRGEFNVPHGRYATPQRVDAENLLRVHEVLQSVEIVEGDFEAILAHAGPGATVYCDPPYWPVSVTARFNFYDGLVFGEAEQRRLGAVFRTLSARGVYGLLSNSDVEATRALYEGLPRREVLCRRSINRDADKRGHVSELLVRTR